LAGRLHVLAVDIGLSTGPDDEPFQIEKTATFPFQDKLDEINARIKENEKETENFLNAIGKSGSKGINLIEGKIEKLLEDLKELQNRRDELTMLIADSPRKVNAQIILDALKDFSRLYDKL